MHVLHASWLPGDDSSFENRGKFIFWAEQAQNAVTKKSKKIHPYHIDKNCHQCLFTELLPLAKDVQAQIPTVTDKIWVQLPGTAASPLPSLELAQIAGVGLADAMHWHSWQINVLSVQQPWALLKEIHYQSQFVRNELLLGADFIFWYRLYQAFKQLVAKHHYIPAIFPYQRQTRSKRKSKTEKIQYFSGWLPLSSQYQRLINHYSASMPGLCRAYSHQTIATDGMGFPQLLDSANLLEQFCRQCLEDLVEHTPFTQRQRKLVEGTLVYDALTDNSGAESVNNNITATSWQQWQGWYQRLNELHREDGLILCFRLHEPPPTPNAKWQMQWLAASRKDPSLKITLMDYWAMSVAQQQQLQGQYGQNFSQQLLLQAGYAARMYPKLWEAMDTDQPHGIALDQEEAAHFLRTDAWVLQDSGFLIIIPAHLTPKGKKRTQLRIKISSSSSKDSQPSSGLFGLSSLAQFNYQLTIDGEVLSEQEWRALIEAKSELVQFRGQWMQINQDEMARMLDYWQKQNQADQQNQAINMNQLLQTMAAAEENGLELEFLGAIEAMMAQLQGTERLKMAPTPADFQGQLRAYQQRGLSWLSYLRHLGLGPLLADDMGLGKTIQIIALLLHERKRQERAITTLLIAPTSVLGNWLKELQRFAPSLRALIHHGVKRTQQAQAFRQVIGQYDIIITSFALIRLDKTLFHSTHWQTVVVDEAQNLKNPKAAQTKAICKLDTQMRIALTGTPIENRLLDLWSIFQFLNPGYLGSAAQFKKRFEQPIGKEQNSQRALTLKRLLEPFILRRLKSDKSIIKDLPDKVEQKTYCNLTIEQASLYQGVVDQVQAALENSEGIARKGLILATLTKLKQICNHPAQFLQDASEYSEQRSCKLERVAQMVTEVIDEQESMLIFTQYTEMAEALVNHFRHHYHHPVLFLHGGTTRNRREKMIEAFQQPDSPPTIFVLSLKAGGVGITLTRANHVFHFDRWWNPAVENQATDRAYRIGQKKKVFVHKMVTLGTLEERIDQMLEEKQRLADSIVGHDESWLTELDNKAFRQLIELNRNEAVLE